MDILQVVEEKIHTLKSSANYRQFVALNKSADTFPLAKTVKDAGEEVMICCSLDYLGMGSHPKVLAAAQETIARSGVSSGGSRNLSGTCEQHVTLEQELARYHNKHSALVFNSGYLANQVTMNLLGSKIDDVVIFSDELNHASIIDGTRSSGAKKVIYRHNDCRDLEEQLKKVDINTPKVVVFESIYSMEGDIADVETTLAVAKKYNALTVLNEVHALGIFGESGRGVASSLPPQLQPDLIIGSLSKGIGVFGGYIVGSESMVDFIRSFGYGFIFTSSLPPSIVAAALASIKHLQASDTERERVLKNAALLRQELLKAGLPMMPSQTHIVPVLVGDSQKNNELSKRLLDEYNILAVAVNFPTVAMGTERLRLVVTAKHTEPMIHRLVSALKACMQEDKC
ncbi:5-aminolevulinate synthase [Thalassomonas viridans]|uniref:5-aminolevulinate synthase n=1 Tax=Thalassomonas viridans TaxID=137584 RepID=A0AAE9Z9K8_9GAMM|nr:5-aminolevulinate synthase [Thalassomonas viridans]WDE09281.1 5-aminolevulinate synthase [Thalassomonas viridans]